MEVAATIFAAWSAGIFAVIALASTLVACATPTPEHRCSKGAHIEASDYYAARGTIDLACQRFADQAGIPIEDTSLDGVQVTVREWRESTDCANSALGCARLRPGPEIIDVAYEDWRLFLLHEVYHVLLWRTGIDVHPEDHHRWLFEHRLCGPDGSLCGYGLLRNQGSLFE